MQQKIADGMHYKRYNIMGYSKCTQKTHTCPVKAVGTMDPDHFVGILVPEDLADAYKLVDLFHVWHCSKARTFDLNVFNAFPFE